MMNFSASGFFKKLKDFSGSQKIGKKFVRARKIRNFFGKFCKRVFPQTELFPPT
jgi:hypothetical protein